MAFTPPKDKYYLLRLFLQNLIVLHGLTILFSFGKLYSEFMQGFYSVVDLQQSGVQPNMTTSSVLTVLPTQPYTTFASSMSYQNWTDSNFTSVPMNEDLECVPFLFNWIIPLALCGAICAWVVTFYSRYSKVKNVLEYASEKQEPQERYFHQARATNADPPSSKLGKIFFWINIISTIFSCFNVLVSNYFTSKFPTQRLLRFSIPLFTCVTKNNLEEMVNGSYIEGIAYYGAIDSFLVLLATQYKQTEKSAAKMAENIADIWDEIRDYWHSHSYPELLLAAFFKSLSFFKTLVIVSIICMLSEVLVAILLVAFMFDCCFSGKARAVERAKNLIFNPSFLSVISTLLLFTSLFTTTAKGQFMMMQSASEYKLTHSLFQCSIDEVKNSQYAEYSTECRVQYWVVLIAQFFGNALSTLFGKGAIMQSMLLKLQEGSIMPWPKASQNNPISKWQYFKWIIFVVVIMSNSLVEGALSFNSLQNFLKKQLSYNIDFYQSNYKDVKYFLLVVQFYKIIALFLAADALVKWGFNSKMALDTRVAELQHDRPPRSVEDEWLEGDMELQHNASLNANARTPLLYRDSPLRRVRTSGGFVSASSVNVDELEEALALENGIR